MKHRNALTGIMILVSACGDKVQATTESPTSTLTTTPGTGGQTASEAMTSTEGPTTDATSMAPTSSTTAAESGPVFLSFNTNVSKITEGESLTFTALLTDPDGVEDIIGGSLLSENEMIDYGPFVAAGQAGTYSFSLSWVQINQAAPIGFENADLPLVFRARFFDQGGHKAINDAEVVLYCDGGSACNGVCTDLGVDGANCGTCDHTCASMGCEKGGCTPTWSACFAAVDGFSTCSEICQSTGEVCAEAQCDGGGTTKYYDNIIDCMKSSGGLSGGDSCDMVQDWLKPALKCCCTDSN